MPGLAAVDASEPALAAQLLGAADAGMSFRPFNKSASFLERHLASGQQADGAPRAAFGPRA